MIRPFAPLLALALLLAPCPAGAQESQRGVVIAGRSEQDWREDLQNPQPIVRQAALEAIAQFPTLDASTVLGLLPLLSDPNTNVRRTAIRAVGRGDRRAARRARPALWRAWRDEDPLVSADAGIALIAIGGEELDEFIRQLGRGTSRDRARAAAALANGGPAAKQAIHGLRDRLNDNDPRVRTAVLAALDELDATPGHRTAELIGRSLARELMASPSLDAPDAVARARTALTLLTRARRDARAAIRPLQMILWDGPSPLRAAAAEVLGLIPNDGDDALAVALAGGNAAVREAAIQGFMTDRERRRPMRIVVDSLRTIDLRADSVRARQMVDAIGHVARRDRHVDAALKAVLSRAPFLAPSVHTARRRMELGF